jgi:hypothetical protein
LLLVFQRQDWQVCVQEGWLLLAVGMQLVLLPGMQSVLGEPCLRAGSKLQQGSCSREYRWVCVSGVLRRSVCRCCGFLSMQQAGAHRQPTGCRS